jgi:hypothetical protein
MASVSIDGYLLAALLTDCCAARGDFDGLLFGTEGVRRTTRLTDETDGARLRRVHVRATRRHRCWCGHRRRSPHFTRVHAVPVAVEERYVHARSYVCATELCAFYDGAGSVDGASSHSVRVVCAHGRGVRALTSSRARRFAEARLAALCRAGGDAPLVGWFVARRGTPLAPSMREAAVWRALQQRAAAAAPPPSSASASATPSTPLFGVLGGEQPLSGEPFSSTYVFFAPGGQPLPLSILNYGRAAPSRAAPPQLAPPSWHPLLDGDGGALDDAASPSPWRALEAAACASAAQARAAFDAAVARGEALCREVEAVDDALQARLARLRSADEAAAAALTPLPEPETQPEPEPAVGARSADVAAGALLEELSSVGDVLSDAEPLDDGEAGLLYVPPPLTPARSILDELLQDELQ